SLSAATTALHGRGFNVNVANTVSSDQPANTVVSQSPQPDTAATKGATVNITLSSGPPQVQVPDVIGYTSQQAVQTLESAGFKVQQQTLSVSDPSQNNIVQQQNPAGGSQATKGGIVTITVGVSSGPPPPGDTTTTTG